MTTTITQITLAARMLREAREIAMPYAPVRDLIGSTDLGLAYAVQEQHTQGRIAHGARVIGRRIGLASVAVQQRLGGDTPDFGVLLDDMNVTGPLVSAARLLQPKIEAEIAFTLCVALEIVDSRIAGWDITNADTVADNASRGLFALGDELVAVEPSEVETSMMLNRDVVSIGNGAPCLGDLLNVLRWLAQTAQEYGNPRRAGQVTLSGALGPTTVVAGGNRIEATLTAGGREVGCVDVRFTGGTQE
ncbi:2-keto-4-pentenoate hydratase [Arthrobacter sp. GAS37]|uniref:2-keto-4-pentenoate hydratase n=1 Tax=Arthrobacter sp. GAS37 TaxID=3156261 RepID=UPI0038398F88